MQLYDVVALMVDLPDEGLKRGQVGTIVEMWDKDVYEVAFADMNGVTYAMVAIPAADLMTLYWHPNLSSKIALEKRLL